MLDGDDDVQQLLCVLHFFLVLVDSTDTFLDSEFVSFSRRCVSGHLWAEQRSFWTSAQAARQNLSEFEIHSRGVIEAADGALQADFANRFIGGGVLAGGLAQEEIRFLASPECMAGCLFVEGMKSNEAVFIVGALQYNRYKGYWEDFEFVDDDGPLRASSARRLDARRRRDVHIVAFDAVSWTRRVKSDQYSERWILRELLKVFAACLGDLEDDSTECRPLATGNWGCGAFKGDPQLKALIQWLAASMANRRVQYHPYGDDRVGGLAEVVKLVQSRNLSCAQLFALLSDLRPPEPSIFEQLRARLEAPKE
mmetsp:Transcript_58291/g.188752  ORF Transcript_58291/g.188752 Transcript_58291/m.188752 type:complete len:310 (+) Transcript_58291:135-1064(+)